MKKIHNFNKVHDSQSVFRILLNAMSNPLKKYSIDDYAKKLGGANQAFLVMAYVLADNETKHYTFENTELSDSIKSLTLSESSNCNEADFIFVDNEDDLITAIKCAKCGTTVSPHKSALIIAKIPEEENAYLTFEGPGIDEKISVITNNLVSKSIYLRNQMQFEYPQGIDFIFVTENNILFCIPRLVNTVKEEF